MKVQLVNFENKSIGEVDLNPEIFGLEPQDDILYKVIHWQLAKQRAGTHQVKERGDVSGSTRKIYRQKGTGRARHGAIRGAQFRGGGIIFGPHFRSHEYKLNKKVRNLGLKFALSTKFKNSQLLVIDNVDLKSSKSSELIKNLKNLQVNSVLIVDTSIKDNLKRSSYNLHDIDVLPTMGVNVYDIINHEKLIITKEALKQIEERLV